MRTLAVLLTLAACSDSSSTSSDADPGDDADVITCPDCSLLAVHPAAASTGDTLALEGTFAETATVDFPGAPGVPATIVGAHRATVVVPAQATSGELRVTTGGATVGPVEFRRVPFTIGVREIAAPEQAEQPRTLPAISRALHCTVTIGSYLYIIGGEGASPDVQVLRSIVHPDGSVGEPELVASFPGSRQAPACAATGTHLYVISGDGSGSISQAPIIADGELGAWTMASAALATPRLGPSASIVGDSLYVIGGIDSTFLGTIERARIAKDGSLGPFATVTTTLATPRFRHTSLVLGGALYVLGGDPGGSTTSVERSPISPDGDLGSFVAGPALTTPRIAPAVVRVGNVIYVIGGAVATSERAAIAGDGTLGSWTAAPALDLPDTRYNFTAVIAANHLYMIGGLSASNGGTLNRRDFLRAPLDESSGLSTFATASAALSTARHSHTATAIGRHLYVLGGRQALLPIDTILHATIAADGTIGTFAPLTAKLAVERSGHATVIGGQFLIVIGGLGAQAEQAKISPEGTLGPFSLLPGSVMTTAREHHSAAVANNIVYVTGGRNGTTLATVERALIAPNLGLGSFTATSNLIAAREGHTSVVLGDKLYVIGGRATPTPYRATIEVATINGDGTLGAFATASMSLQVPRAFHTSAVVGRYLYVFGGENAGTNLASVERAPISADGTLGAFATVSGVTLNTARNKLAAVALGSSVVLVGGTMGQSDQGILTSIERAALE